MAARVSPLRVHLFDYGVGNIHSISKALRAVGAHVTIVSDPERLVGARAIVLPGVGAFGAAIDALAPTPRLRSALRLRLLSSTAPPTLGVCVGFQVLCRSSEESRGAGVGVFPTAVRRLRRPPVPHMGWALVTPRKGRGIAALRSAHPALRTLPSPPYLYYAHSYGPRVDRYTLAQTVHGVPFGAIAARGRVLGVQFHPEKSAGVGLALLRGWAKWASAIVRGDPGGER